jgi:hypothetical protein
VGVAKWDLPPHLSSSPARGEEIFSVLYLNPIIKCPNNQNHILLSRFGFRSLRFGHYLIIGAWNLIFTKLLKAFTLIIITATQFAADLGWMGFRTASF